MDMETLNKNKAAKEIMKVITDVLNKTQYVLHNAEELRKMDAPKDIIEATIEASASIIFDVATEDVKHILDDLVG